MSACDVLVHTSCTTATEAYALGRPAVCYQTLPSPLHEYFLSGKLSIVAKTEDEVIQQVASIISGNFRSGQDRTQEHVFNSFFAAQSGAFAAERIASYVEVALAHKGVAREDETQWQPGWLFRRKWWPSKFQLRIFPDFSTDYIQKRINQLAAAIGVSAPPRVEKCGDGQYHIYPAHMRRRAYRRKFSLSGVWRVAHALMLGS